MTEDSGAFKTNPGNSAQIGHFVIARDRCGKDASGGEKASLIGAPTPAPANFITNRFEALR